MCKTEVSRTSTSSAAAAVGHAVFFSSTTRTMGSAMPSSSSVTVTSGRDWPVYS